jgi:hypothetical protein
LLWNDRIYDGLQATDGVAINSRAKHRQYMADRGLTTADDFTQEWKKAAEKRADLFHGKTGAGSVRRQDIEMAIHQLQSRKK